MGSRVVSREELFERIEVVPPYFALGEVSQGDDGVLTAGVPVTQALGNEPGPITATEAGRHLAILGSCAAALANPAGGRHFYLAYDAEVRRSRTRVDDADPAGLVASARSHFVDPGTAVALTDLRTDDGRTVYTIVVFYLVVAEADFRALFAEHAQPDADLEGRPDPYADIIGLQDVSIWDTRMHGTLGSIDPYRCAGHFPGLPAMPVAFLLANVGDAAGRLLAHVLGRGEITYVIREASIRAENLAFAGERVDVHVEYQRFAGGVHWLHCAAIAEGQKPVGKVHLKLRVRD
jgi:hypothetical protein